MHIHSLFQMHLYVEEPDYQNQYPNALLTRPYLGWLCFGLAESKQGMWWGAQGWKLCVGGPDEGCPFLAGITLEEKTQDTRKRISTILFSRYIHFSVFSSLCGLASLLKSFCSLR